MKRRVKFCGIVFDIALSIYTALAILWLCLIVGVSFVFPALFVISLFSIFVHEFGHLVGALATGLKITLFASWPLMVVRTPRGFHLRHFNLPSPMLGAVVAFPWNVKHLAWKRGLFLCAGLAANLLVAGGSLALAYALNETHYGSFEFPYPFGTA